MELHNLDGHTRGSRHVYQIKTFVHTDDIDAAAKRSQVAHLVARAVRLVWLRGGVGGGGGAR